MKKDVLWWNLRALSWLVIAFLIIPFYYAYQGLKKLKDIVLKGGK